MIFIYAGSFLESGTEIFRNILTPSFSAGFVFERFLYTSNLKQPAGKINFAVVRNSSGDIVVNQAVKFKLTVKRNSPAAAEVYVETQSATTNSFGQKHNNCRILRFRKQIQIGYQIKIFLLLNQFSILFLKNSAPAIFSIKNIF